MTKRSWAPLLALPVVLSLTACGSTALRGGTVAKGDGIDIPVTPDGSLTGEVGTGGSSPGTPSAVGGTQVAASRPGSRPTASAGAVDVTTPGRTLASATPVRVGIAGTNTAAIAAVFGKKASETFARPKSLIAQINKTGGIGGRKIEPVFYEADSGADASTVGQEACAAFTEDDKVDIVLNAGLLGDVLQSCLERRGVAMLDPGTWAMDTDTMRSHPNWLQPLAMRVDRYARAQLEISAQLGVLKKGDTLGVLIESCPCGPKVMSGTIEPLAKKLGVNLVQATFKCVQNVVADLAPVTNDVMRETLRFNTSNVNKVMIVSGAEAFALSLFTKNASQQGYFPTYIMSSNAYPYNDSQPDGVVTYSADALPRMTGVGANPLLDVGPLAKSATTGQAAAQARCRQADPDLGAGEGAEGPGRYFAHAGFYALCDTFYVMKALLEANGMRFSLADVTRGYRAALGTLASATLPGGRFGLGSTGLDGGGVVQPFRYDTQRQTFTYVGRATRVA